MQALDYETGFGSLMDQHAPSVRATVRAVLGRSADEDDLIQEVFTRLLVRLRQEEGVEVGPWCRRTARNLAIDQLRRRSATPTEDRMLDRPCGDSPDEEVAGRELAAVLASSLRRLPAHHRRVLLAQVRPGPGAGSRTHAEIGAEMGLSAKATESLLARARQRLRIEMQRREAGTGAGPAIRDRFVAAGVVSGPALSGPYLTGPVTSDGAPPWTLSPRRALPVGG